MIKGIKCVECENVFKWIELKPEDKISWNTCNCPKCKTSIKTIFPIKNLVIFFIIVATCMAFLLYSITNFSKQTTQALSLLTMAVGIFGGRGFFNGYIYTVKAAKKPGAPNA